MSVNLRFASLARVATIALALAIPVATAAYADDEYNSGRDAVNLQSAESASPFSSVRSAAGAHEDTRVTSTVPMVGGKHDVLGAGGGQDDLANKIYQPGHTVGVGG